jgi:hypothetical protein
MDISNTQQNLFNTIDRAYNAYQKPIEKGVSSMGHINLIQARSNANFPYQKYGQLDIATHIGCIGKANSQRSELTDPLIKCTPRHNESASRFNYAYDMQITTHPTEVSGVNIPNNQLRIIPNRGTQLCYQKTIMPVNQEIYNLSRNIIGICGTDTSELDNQNLQFKASRQRLTREELQGLARINTTPALAVP